MNRHQLDESARAWRRTLKMRNTVILFAATLAASGLGLLWFTPGSLVPIAGAVFVVALMIRLTFARPWKLDAVQVVHHLNRTFPALEESSALWLRDAESLSVVERLQRQRIDTAALRLVEGERQSFAAPPKELVQQPLVWLAIGFLIFAAVFAWSVATSRQWTTAEPRSIAPAPSKEADIPVNPSAPQWPLVEHAEMVIVPPPYTARTERRVSGLDAEVEEGATVAWSIALDRPVEQLQLVFGESGAPLALEPTGDGPMQAKRIITETALYNITGVLPDGAAWKPSELHSLKVIKDKPPGLQIVHPALPRTEIATSSVVSSAKVAVEILASDDYGISGAHLIATVAKGTGEAVKFREQKIAFDGSEPSGDGSDRRRFIKTLDLGALGLEPGDELYFHVAAADNREPAPNHARSETRFVVLKGPEQGVSTPGAGVTGINLVPQYFRSQRQIIIDTEKLIADRPTLTESDFRERANNLGIDQQLLRQRYGQFLGEEAESDEPPEEHFEGDGHDHGPPPGQTGPLTQEQITAQYGHQHDSQDTATLFDRAVKGTMRQALAAMWEAERFLRAAQPNEALVPENRALEILKALQESDRAYVQRVGFEATPLNIAERRLRGDVSTVPHRIISKLAVLQSDEAVGEIRELLRLAPWTRAASALTSAETDLMRRVEATLTKAATEKPETFLAALQELRRLLGGDAPSREKESRLERALLHWLPSATARPVQEEESSPSLAESYFRNLEQAEVAR